MSNPFDKHRAEATGGGGELPPGESRIYTGTAKDGATKTVQLVRTNRSYVEDLAEAYNASMSKDAKDRGLLWFVTPAGELKLGDNEAWSRANAKRIESRRETERARFVRHQLEHDPA